MGDDGGGGEVDFAGGAAVFFGDVGVFGGFFDDGVCDVAGEGWVAPSSDSHQAVQRKRGDIAARSFRPRRPPSLDTAASFYPAWTSAQAATPAFLEAATRSSCVEPSSAVAVAKAAESRAFAAAI